MNNRDFLTLNRQIIRGEANGKVLWQPRIICWYADRQYRNEPLPAPYTGMSIRELYDALDCSNRIYDYNEAVKLIEDPSIKRYSKKLDELRTQHFVETPEGTIDCILKRNRSNYGEFFEKWWVEDQKDMEVQMYIEAHQDYVFDEEAYNRVYEIWGNNGLGSIYFPRINVQSLFNDTMGVEGGIFALMDMPDVCEEYFKIKSQNHDRFIKMIETSKFEWINFGDNVHCATLPPSLFEQYVLPEYKLRCERLHKAGKFVYSHFDGDNRGLMEFYRETGLDGIEAITPKPQGDVTLEEVHEHLGDMFLLDGIPAVYFDEEFPEEVLVDCVHKILDLFAPNLVLGISDEISSTGDIERIRLVGKIVDEYNAKIRAEQSIEE